jgi:hypothetical protein
MKLFIADTATETDTFVPFPTGESGVAASLALGRASLGNAGAVRASPASM